VSARSVWTLDVTKLALKTQVDDLIDIVGFQFLGVDFGILRFGAIVVDSVKKLWKTTAVTHAETAIRTDAENPFGFGAKIFGVVVTRIRRIVCGIYAHRAASSK
jgi:hypothetical protein